jgi:hypothetical protein
VQHHLPAAGSGDVRRQVAEQHGPAEHGAEQTHRDRVDGEVLEHRRPAEQVPDTLVGLIVRVVAEEVLYSPARTVFGGSRIQVVANIAQGVVLEYPRHGTDAVLHEIVLGSLDIIGRGGKRCLDRHRDPLTFRSES